MERGKDSLCTLCGNFASGCSWSSDFIPVEGWKAVPNTSQLMGGLSYHVEDCPNYISDEYAPKDVYDSGIEDLAMAIVQRAVLDYVDALNYANKEHRIEIEEWADAEEDTYLISGVRLNYILREARRKHHEFERIAEQHWRKKADKHGEVHFKCPFCGGTATIKKIRGIKAARCTCGCTWSKSRIARMTA